MISYAPFWKLMKKEKMSQYRLIREGKLSAQKQPACFYGEHQTNLSDLLLQCIRHYGIPAVRRKRKEQGGSVSVFKYFL